MRAQCLADKLGFGFFPRARPEVNCVIADDMHSGKQALDALCRCSRQCSFARARRKKKRSSREISDTRDAVKGTRYLFCLNPFHGSTKLGRHKKKILERQKSQKSPNPSFSPARIVRILAVGAPRARTSVHKHVTHVAFLLSAST